MIKTLKQGLLIALTLALMITLSNAMHPTPLEAQAPTNVATPAFNGVNITTNTTTVVKSGGGILHTICVGTVGTGTATFKIYDSALLSAGTSYGTFTTDSKGCYVFDIVFRTGLAIYTTSTTAANITVNYR